MTLVSGPLSTVTADPSAVSVVQVSVQGPRTVGTGVQTHESKNVAVSGGVFSHEIAPGPATLTMIVGQKPGPTIPILVGDVASQTLANAVNAAKVATGDHQKWLEDLALQVVAGTEGPPGVPGPEGPAGTSPILTVGDITTVGPDQPATADLTQVHDDTYALSMNIPRGATGSVDSVDQAVQDALNDVAYPAINAARDDAVNEVSGVVDTEIGSRVDQISRGTGEAWLRATDVPNYRDLPPGNYRALTDFLQGVGVDGARTGYFHRTWTNSAGTTFIDQVMWIESATKLEQRYRSVWSTGMGEWINPASPTAPYSGSISASRQEAVRERLFQSRGGRVGTAGKGVVALRIDHGVPAFTQSILPMLEARGLPASQCHFIEDPEADWAQANTNFGSGIEVHSHSWTHGDAASPAGIHKEIVESRQELEQLIPNAFVAGWITPGVGAGAYGGWWDATGVEARASFFAQQLIDSTYGSADTNNSVWNVLGARHWSHRSIDRVTNFDQWQSLIDQAAATRSGVVLMVHPSFIRDSSSYIDFSQYEQVLDYIVQLRDSGKIEVLTVAGMTLADPSTDYRDNILHGDLSIWSGWGSGGSRAGTPSSGLLEHSVSLSNIPHVKGHVREFAISASGTGELRVRIFDSGGLLDVSRDFDIAGPKTARIPVGIPRSGSRIWFEISTLSGEVAVEAPLLRSI